MGWGLRWRGAVGWVALGWASGCGGQTDSDTDAGHETAEPPTTTGNVMGETGGQPMADGATYGEGPDSLGGDGACRNSAIGNGGAPQDWVVPCDAAADLGECEIVMTVVWDEPTDGTVVCEFGVAPTNLTSSEDYLPDPRVWAGTAGMGESLPRVSGADECNSHPDGGGFFLTDGSSMLHLCPVICEGIDELILCVAW